MSDIGNRIAELFEERLKRIPELNLINIRRGMLISGTRIDIDAVVERKGQEYEIIAEIKSDGSPGAIRGTISKLKSLGKTFSREGQVYPVIGAPYISDDGMEICKEERVGCVDSAGNCYLSFDGIYVEIRGNKNPKPSKKNVKSLFSPRSSRVIRVFLSDAQKWWQVQEIAEEAAISIGLVSRLKRKLLEEEFVVEQSRKLKVKSPVKLINVWADSYKYKRNAFKEYYAINSGPIVEEAISDYCNRRGIPYALGLFSAASRIAPHVRMNRVFIYVDTNLDTIAEALNFKPVSSGPNVVLLNPYDKGVFYGSREIDGLNVVSDVQMYLDLKSYKGRGEEAADFLMQQSLEPLWQQNQITSSAR